MSLSEEQQRRAASAAKNGVSAPLTRFFQRVPRPVVPGVTLPEPTGGATQRQRTEACNAAVAAELLTRPEKKKRAKKSSVPPELKLEIAQYQLQSHPRFTLRKFKARVAEEGYGELRESAVRKWEAKLAAAAKEQGKKAQELQIWPGKPLGGGGAAETGQEFRDLLVADGWIPYTLPPNCTSELQPCDAVLNAAFKQGIKKRFIEWYSNEMCRLLNKKKELEEKNPALAAKFKLQVDVSLVRIKDPHLTWMVQSWNDLRANKTVGVASWQECGLGSLRTSVSQL
eukprot:tig00020944_g16356.t1